MHLRTVGIACAHYAILAHAQTTPLTGSHTDLPRWCGKPYKAGSPNFDPGGMLQPPSPQPSELLQLEIRPRYSLYVSHEKTAELIVDASLSKYHGFPYDSATQVKCDKQKCGELTIDVRVENYSIPLMTDKLQVNTTDNLYSFNLTKIEPSLEPYLISLTAHSMNSNQFYTKSTELYYLPHKDSGSTVKIDNLNGGMLMANNVSNYEFEPLLPYGFYAQCSGFLEKSLENVREYVDQGYTAVNPVCSLADGPLNDLFDWLDVVNMPFQYDMRGSYFNLTSLTEQVELIKDHSALLSWYTGDEPDGWQYSFSSITDAYQLLKRLDPYHPTGLVLNCENYYFDRYTEGTDYIMEDAYPIGINATYSRKFGTVINETYGDGGCDNCKGSILDVSQRLDTLYEYQNWLGRPQKPLWAVPQAFSGEQYWARDPTQQEAWAMSILGFNHGAKAALSWTFPTTKLLEAAHSSLATVVTKAPLKSFLLGGNPSAIKSSGDSKLDISYWYSNGTALVGLVNAATTTASNVVINTPFNVKCIVDQPWGNASWGVNAGYLNLQKVGGLESSFVVIDVESENLDVKSEGSAH